MDLSKRCRVVCAELVTVGVLLSACGADTDTPAESVLEQSDIGLGGQCGTLDGNFTYAEIVELSAGGETFFMYPEIAKKVVEVSPDDGQQQYLDTMCGIAMADSDTPTDAESLARAYQSSPKLQVAVIAQGLATCSMVEGQLDIQGFEYDRPPLDTSMDAAHDYLCPQIAFPGYK